MIKHEGFVYEAFKNDIGLIKLPTEIEFSPFILPACLTPENDNLRSYDDLTVSGWGFTKLTMSTSNKLLKTRFQIVDSTYCQAKYTEVGFGITITKDHYCAVGVEPGGDACGGM